MGDITERYGMVIRIDGDGGQAIVDDELVPYGKGCVIPGEEYPGPGDWVVMRCVDGAVISVELFQVGRL